MFADNVFLQRLLISIGHLAVRFFGYGVGVDKRNSPIKKQPQLGLHGADTGFHYDKIAFWNGFELVGRHERTLHHLQGLAGIAFTTGYAAAQDSALAQRPTEHLRRLAVRRKATEDGILTVVGYNFRAFLA